MRAAPLEARLACAPYLIGGVPGGLPGGGGTLPNLVYGGQ